MSSLSTSLQRQRWPLWFWLLTLLAPIVFLGLMYQLENRTTLGDRWHVVEAEYLSSNAIQPPRAGPLDQTAWQAVSVPQENFGDQLQPSSGWLRIPLPIPLLTTETIPTTEWMVFIPNPSNANYSLWLSGVRFAKAGHHRSTDTSMPKNPISMEFPRLALRDDEEHVLLHITKEIGGIDINNIYLGPSEDLRSYSDHATFIKKTLIRAILLMMGIMATVMFFIHLLRRSQTSLYGWYALGITVWFIHTLHAQHESATFGSVWFWFRITYVTLAVYVFAGIVFVNRLTERMQPRLELALLLLLVTGSVFILIDPVGVDGILYFNSVFWIPAIILGGLYMMVRLASGAGKNPDTQTLLLLAATFLGVCVGFRDYLHNNLQLVAGGMLYTRHAAGLILVAYSFVMIRRFAEADLLLQRSASGSKLAGSTSDSLINPAKFQHSHLQQEHDALELQLQKAVLDVEPTEGSAQFNNSIRAARHDLQLIRDMMSHDDDSPAGELLTNMQSRLSQLAIQQPVSLIWKTPFVSDVTLIAGHQELALARFLQVTLLEALAFSAVIKIEAHAHRQTVIEGVAMVVTVDTFLVNSSNVDFVKRAQMEAAARDLNGLLVFAQDDEKLRVTLSWTPIPAHER